MASDILHIKDSYYFEIPKVLAPANYDAKANYPAHLNVWVKLDDQFQEWEFGRLYEGLKLIVDPKSMPEKAELHKEWHHWSHGHGKPLDAALEEQAELLEADYKTWLEKEDNSGQRVNTGKNFDDYLAVTTHPAKDVAWFATKYHGAAWRQKQWAEAKEAAGGDAAIADFKTLGGQWDWNAAKIAAYNHQLSGKLPGNSTSARAAPGRKRSCGRPS